MNEWWIKKNAVYIDYCNKLVILTVYALYDLIIYLIIMHYVILYYIYELTTTCEILISF